MLLEGVWIGGRPECSHLLSVLYFKFSACTIENACRMTGDYQVGN